jgi:hypothetical protein
MPDPPAKPLGYPVRWWTTNPVIFPPHRPLTRNTVQIDFQSQSTPLAEPPAPYRSPISWPTALAPLEQSSLMACPFRHFETHHQVYKYSDTCTQGRLAILRIPEGLQVAFNERSPEYEQMRWDIYFFWGRGTFTSFHVATYGNRPVYTKSKRSVGRYERS